MELILRYIELLDLCRSELYDTFLADIEERCLEEIGILLRYNHNHDTHTGRFTSGNGVDNGGESGIIKLEDIEIGKSLSAKAKNYNIMDLQTGDTFHFSEGTKIQDVQVLLGKVQKLYFVKQINTQNVMAESLMTGNTAKARALLIIMVKNVKPKYIGCNAKA